jgi:uncharacterized protein
LALGFACAATAFAQSPRPRPVADHHQHLFSPTIAEAGSYPLVDAARMAELLDAGGIRKAVLLSLAYSYGNPNRPNQRSIERELELVRAENDWTAAQAARLPERFVAFCSVNPLKPYALDEIARCAADPQLKRGLKLHIGNSDVRMHDPAHVARLREVFALANQHRMPIVVHLRSTISTRQPYGRKAAWTFLTEVLPAASQVDVQIAHLAGAGGFDDPTTDQALAVYVAAVARKDPRMRRVWFDASGVAGLGRWKAHLPRIARRIRQLGVERVVWGSDGAGGQDLTPAQAWQAFTELPLTAAERRTIAANVAPYLR